MLMLLLFSWATVNGPRLGDNDGNNDGDGDDDDDDDDDNGSRTIYTSIKPPFDEPITQDNSRPSKGTHTKKTTSNVTKRRIVPMRMVSHRNLRISIFFIACGEITIDFFVFFLFFLFGSVFASLFLAI